MPIATHRILFKPIEGCTTEGCHADVYLPERPENAPIAIIIHGGAFTWGTSTHIPPDQVDYFLSRDVAVISLEYRLAPHVLMPAIREDLLDGYVFVQEKLNDRLGSRLDVGRCVMLGWSAGGASILFMDRDIESLSPALTRPLGLVPTYPLTDANACFHHPESAYTAHMEADPAKAALANKVFGEKIDCGIDQGSDWGAPPDLSGASTPRDVWCTCRIATGTLNTALFGHSPPFLPHESAITSVTPTHTPTFIVCAESDQLIDPAQSRDLFAKLKENRVECEMREAKGMWHGVAEDARSTWPEGVQWWEKAILPSLEWAVGKLKG